MRRRYLAVSIILLAVVAGFALIFLFTGTIMRSGSDTIPGTQEQTSGVIPVHTPAFSPATVTMNTSPEPTTLATPPLTVAAGTGAAYPYPVSTTALEQRVHELINQQRTDKSLGALSFDPALADIARKHSGDMAAQHYFAHMNPAGQVPRPVQLLPATSAGKTLARIIPTVLRKISSRTTSILLPRSTATARPCTTGTHLRRLHRPQLLAG